MSLRYPEAALFCLAWAALAIVGWQVSGWVAGILLSVGLFVLIMPATAFVLTRTGSFGRERAVRWAMLAVAALILAIWADFNP